MPETNSLKSGLEDLKIDRSRGRKPRGRRFSAAWIVAGVAVLVALGAWRGAALFLGPPEVDLHLVTVPRAGSAGPAIVLQAAGYVVPHYRIEVASKVVGRVKWMGVEKGDFVEHGPAHRQARGRGVPGAARRVDRHAAVLEGSPRRTGSRFPARRDRPGRSGPARGQGATLASEARPRPGDGAQGRGRDFRIGIRPGEEQPGCPQRPRRVARQDPRAAQSRPEARGD